MSLSKFKDIKDNELDYLILNRTEKSVNTPVDVNKLRALAILIFGSQATKPLFTIKEAAPIFNIKPATLSRKLNTGELPGFKIGDWQISLPVILLNDIRKRQNLRDLLVLIESESDREKAESLITELEGNR
jgi:hypothetical protein